MIYSKNISKNKIYKHINCVQKLSQYGKAFPICLEIHPTNICQHNCINCSSQETRSKNREKHIDGDLLKSILLQFKSGGGKAVLWSGGGEPVLYHCNKTNYDIGDILEYTYSLGLSQGFYTNGEMLNLKLIETISSVCTFLRFSIDAFSYDTHSKVHRTKSFTKVLNNIKECIRVKEETKSEIDIGLSYVIYDNNILDIFRIKKFLNSISVNYLYFKPGTLRVYQTLATLKQKVALYYIKRFITDFYVSTHIEIAHEKFDNILKNSLRPSFDKCYMGALYPTIAADSKLYCCCHHVNQNSFIIGDVSKDSLDTIYKKFNLDDFQDISGCPRNCRGHIINQDVEDIMILLKNKHTDFL